MRSNCHSYFSQSKHFRVKKKKLFPHIYGTIENSSATEKCSQLYSCSIIHELFFLRQKSSYFKSIGDSRRVGVHDSVVTTFIVLLAAYVTVFFFSFWDTVNFKTIPNILNILKKGRGSKFLSFFKPIARVFLLLSIVSSKLL